MTAALKVTKAYICESIDYGPNDVPVRWKPLQPDSVPASLITAYFYLLIEGPPGAYWLTVDVESYASASNNISILNFPSAYAKIDTAGKFDLTLPIELSQLEPGRYVLTIRAAGQKLASIDFPIPLI